MLMQGNALRIPLADESVHCVVTSPPYWGLRDYGIGDQLGLEPTPEQYVASMVEVFREVKRVMRHDGTLWLNMGDSYATSQAGNKEWGDGIGSNKHYQDGSIRLAKRSIPASLKPKDLCGIPWRLARALQEPYYTGCIREEKNRMWLAALMDGEGCFGIRRQKSSGNRNPEWNDSFIPYSTVKMSDRAPLDYAVQITGLGKVREVVGKVGLDHRKVKTNRQPYVWRLDGNKAVQIAHELYPYLLVKKLQAACIYTLDVSNKNKRRGKGHVVPEKVIEERSEILKYIRALNQRQTNQEPDWLKEPPSLYEPGWYLRSDIIWSKPNPMPESVTDRPTKAHEYLFLLTKSKTYYYDAQAIVEAGAGRENFGQGQIKCHGNKDRNDAGRIDMRVKGYRNRRTVWHIATAPYSGAHFATYPPALVEPCIKAGTSERGVCPECGAPWERVVEKNRMSRPELPKDDPRYRPGRYIGKLTPIKGEMGDAGYTETTTLGWRPTCTHYPQVEDWCEYPDQRKLSDGEYAFVCAPIRALRDELVKLWEPYESVPATVFDPFAGSGTTLQVARQLGRNGIGLDLSLEYLHLARQRLSLDALKAWTEGVGHSDNGKDGAHKNKKVPGQTTHSIHAARKEKEITDLPLFRDKDTNALS